MMVFLRLGTPISTTRIGGPARTTISGPVHSYLMRRIKGFWRTATSHRMPPFQMSATTTRIRRSRRVKVCTSTTSMRPCVAPILLLHRYRYCTLLLKLNTWSGYNRQLLLWIRSLVMIPVRMYMQPLTWTHQRCKRLSMLTPQVFLGHGRAASITPNLHYFTVHTYKDMIRSFR